MNVKDLMQERSKANMEVTVASQPLIGAVNQDGPIKAACPIKAALKKDLCRMHELLTVIDLKMEFENPNSEALKLDKDDVQSTWNFTCDNMTKLGSIETSEQEIHLQKEVDDVVFRFVYYYFICMLLV